VTEENVPLDPIDTPETRPARTGPATPVTPPQSRFLFVDVAALRAKQLRRGATPRLIENAGTEADDLPEMPFKPERIAMEEVRRGLVEYTVPELHPPTGHPEE